MNRSCNQNSYITRIETRISSPKLWRNTTVAIRIPISLGLKLSLNAYIKVNEVEVAIRIPISLGLKLWYCSCNIDCIICCCNQNSYITRIETSLRRSHYLSGIAVAIRIPISLGLKLTNMWLFVFIANLSCNQNSYITRIETPVLRSMELKGEYGVAIRIPISLGLKLQQSQ